MLRFVDSFDYYTAAQLPRKWTSVINPGALTSISAGNGRRGTNCLRLASYSSSSGVAKTLGASDTWIVGFAFLVETLAAGVTSIVALSDVSTVQVTVAIGADGRLSITRGTSTILATSDEAISTDIYNYIEVKAVIHNSAGSVEVRLNGSTVPAVQVSGVDTQASTNASANVITFGAVGGATSVSGLNYDDVYMCDGSGTTNNDFLGDCRIDVMRPNGNGNSSQLTGSDGNSTDNYLLVDETTADDDSTYVESGTVGQKDTYAFSDLSHTPETIFGVQLNIVANKDDAGSITAYPITRSGGTDYQGTAFGVSTDYFNKSSIRETDPDTSSAWALAGLNAAEFGLEIATS